MVLVVDAECAAAENVCRLLGEIGWATRAVHSLTDAREFLGAIATDCLVLDVSFPDGDVKDLLVTLARRRAAPAAVVVSALTRAQQVAANFGLPLVAKPIDPDHFIAAVQVAIDSRITPAEPRQL
jgi:DNA-binding response OmpR family regulator